VIHQNDDEPKTLERSIAGIPLQVSSPTAAATHIAHLASTQLLRGIGVHLINAFSISLADRNTQYAEVLRRADYNYPDGKPLTWVSMVGGPKLTQVRGPQFFNDVLDVGRGRDVKHFLLGGSEELLVKLERAIEARHPGARVVGSFSPPFRQMSDEELKHQDDLIRASGADVVWVGLGTPKQDFEVDRLASALPVVACAVGAAFDFMSGMKKEAPRWLGTIGMEWLYRLLSEPRRLWRRYLIGNAVFIVAALRPHRS
jgi:N-acetylglucosaminyldiphosphoundecaprenol N-acetyl-beta-D-mannosaminyltransferase